MSQITPTSLCSEQLESQVNGVNNSGNTDILHFISNGEIVSWIDYDGFPGGNLNTGGGGTTVVSVDGVPVLNPNFVEGANVTLSVSGSDVTVASAGGATGVTSINSITGDATVSAGSGISISTLGQNIEVINTSSALTLPWIDIQNFGAHPFQITNPQQRAFATTTAGSAVVNLTSAIFTNGQGLVIWQAGHPTTQSTPSPPTGSALCVSGSSTLNYEVVGVDALGGLTASSSNLQITTAPAVFGNLSVPIVSIVALSGTVTVTFGSPINAVAGQTIHITDVNSVHDTTFNGVWPVVSAPTASEITYSLGNSFSGTGSTTAATMGRLSNVQPISTISRDSTGLITIITSQEHNYVATPGSSNPAVIIVENVSPADLNGQWVMQTASGFTITAHSGNQFAESGTVTLGSSTVTSYEYTYITCPAYSGTTTAYYIYSDSPSPGNGLVLIGKTMPFERGFKDYGPTLMQGYTAPGYVPTTPSASPQNQLFASTVIAGGGTTSITLNAHVPASVTNSTSLKDDGQALIAALAAATVGNSQYSSVILSPPQTPGNFPSYVFNYPITIPTNITLIVGCRAMLNETLTFAGGNNIYAPFGSSYNSNPQFGVGNYATITGVASPLIYLSGPQTLVEGIGFFPGGGLTGNVNQNNGQIGMLSQNGKQTFRDCAFFSGPSSTSVPCVFNSAIGGSSSIAMQDCQFGGSTIFGNASVPGQSAQGPAIGNLLLHCNDQGSGIGVAQFALYGNISFSGRGILLDNRNWTTSSSDFYTFGGLGTIEYQSPNTASVMCWGPVFGGIKIDGWLNDSAQGALLANWTSTELEGVFIGGTTSGNASLVTGNFVYFYASSGLLNTSATSTAILGQSTNLILQTGSASFTTTGTSSNTLTIYGVQANSQVTITPTNALAAADIAAGNVYISSKTPNTIVIAHGTTSAMTFDVIAIIY